MAPKKDAEVVQGTVEMRPAPFDIQAKERLTAADLHTLYPQLALALEDAAVQEAATKAFKGYDSTGYGYQYLVNRMNEILGPSHWHETHVIVQDEVVPGGKTQYEVAMKMTIQIGNWHFDYEHGNMWECIATRTLYGGHISKSKADALKGAFTNTFKKTVALYGPGRQAYEGSIDDDFSDADGAASAKVGGEQKVQGPSGRPVYGSPGGGGSGVVTGQTGSGPRPITTNGAGPVPQTENKPVGVIQASQKKAIMNMLTLKASFDIAGHLAKIGAENTGNLEVDLGKLNEDQARQLIQALNQHK